MGQGKVAGPERKWYDSGHASLCVLGSYLRQAGFFEVLEAGLRLHQKVLQYTPVQKLEMLFVSLLAGAQTVYETGTTLRTDPALRAAFGLPGCADQSVIADTLDAATPTDVMALRAAVEALFVQYRQTRRHDFARTVLVLDLDLSPLPASRSCEGSTRGDMGRCRSKTGRKLVRVRAAQDGETVWEDVLEGRSVETQRRYRSPAPSDGRCSSMPSAHRRLIRRSRAPSTRCCSAAAPTWVCKRPSCTPTIARRWRPTSRATNGDWAWRGYASTSWRRRRWASSCWSWPIPFWSGRGAGWRSGFRGWSTLALCASSKKSGRCRGGSSSLMPP